MQTYSLTSPLLDSVVCYSLDARESKGTSAGKKKTGGRKREESGYSMLFSFLSPFFNSRRAHLSFMTRLFIQTE